jgi:CRISPR-associated protein Cmr3
MNAVIKTRTLVLTPLDLLFFRDGRPFDAAAQVRSGLPQTQTVTGAVRSWLLARAGCDFAHLAEDIARGATFVQACAAQGNAVAHIGRLRFRGPWFSRDGASPLLPVPATLRRRKERNDTNFIRLDPLQKPLPGWRSDHGLQPLWYKGNDRLEAVAGYLTLDGMAEFLRGDVPSPEALVTAGQLYAEDRRISVAISPQQLSALEGQIFSVGFLALKPNVSLLVEIDAPAEMILPEQGVIRLGGEGRQVHLLALPNPIPWPRATPKQGRKLFVLTTPVVFADGWKPQALAPLAAAVPAPMAVSGWDMARGGPKPTRFAVPAGAVYFVNDTSTAAAEAFRDGEDAASGAGHTLEGAWNYV